MIRRPQYGPPLLQEILKLIESTPLNKTQPETLQRASIIRSSNTSLVSLLSRRKETYVKRMHEPALNILNTLASLKRISTSSDTPINRKILFRKTRGFEECVYYVLTYGSINRGNFNKFQNCCRILGVSCSKIIIEIL